MPVELIAAPDLQQEAWGYYVDQAKDTQLLGSAPAQVIEIAGRTCYDSFGTGRSSEAYHKHLLEVGHGSVLEHAQYVFRVHGVSRGLTHELIRHRAGTAVSQRSTRYVDESEGDWVVHPVLAEYLETDMGAFLKDSLESFQQSSQRIYRNIVELLEAHMTSVGVDKFTARKQARGAARGFLGNALETELIWSANVRALRNVIEQRGVLAADAEIRGFALDLLGIMKVELPEYFSDYEVHTDETTGWQYVTTDYRKV